LRLAVSDRSNCHLWPIAFVFLDDQNNGAWPVLPAFHQAGSGFVSPEV
jgi:hypothetical protein